MRYSSLPQLMLLLLVTLSAACRSSKEVSLPKGIPIVTRAQWGAVAPLLPMKTQVPQKITIHHTATNQNLNRTLEEKLKALQKFSVERSTLSSGRVKEPWADIPYHFYIDVKGQIGEGRQLQFVGDSNTPYDPWGHALIVLEGNFQTEKVTEAQRQSLEQLTLALAKRWKISAENISGHKDNAATACPGEDLYQLLPQLRELVSSKR
ncbi:peptidoglycan recognition family protein [Rufibacter sp. XAAS-G3-1]|uniref:peptidoglycan recognition protein family protein n=1 Tax=Rufibacter sp. XAAS-G3-1 TaxID=2729134 RepID=UPI002104FC31|nr:peptidoglycan recognition family protein [Rufibacter sp. XAAS-G3-1]